MPPPQTPYAQVQLPHGQQARVAWFQADESLSRPFLCKATVYIDADQGPWDVSHVVQDTVTLTLDTQESSRHFHGVITHIRQDKAPLYAKDEGWVYTLIFRPQVWLLSYTQNSRIFQNMSALDIVKAVLSEYDIDVTDKTQTRGQKQREFCVQYQESHWHFIQRLLEEESIFYMFSFTQSSHTLVLADDYSAYVTGPDGYFSQKRSKEGHHVHQFSPAYHMAPDQVCLQDFAYETPQQNLWVSEGEGDYAVFSYPGDYQTIEDGHDRGHQHFQRFQNREQSFYAQSSLCSLSPGTTLSLQNHPQSDLNDSYVVTRIRHTFAFQDAAWSSPQYSNSLDALKGDMTYIPEPITKKPRIYGTQTAQVTGPDDEEIWTEEQGRIKVKFHWDHQGKDDETSSCWIRIATSWAGQNWGVMHIPRVNQEVVVSFLNGDPDRPLVVGSVYNGDHAPAMEKATQSIWKSQSTPQAEGFNMIRLEDEAQAEEIYVHAQKDLTTCTQESQTHDILQGSITTTIHRGDRITYLKGEEKPVSGQGDDTLILDTGSQTLHLKAENRPAHRQVQLNEGNDTRILQKGDDSTTLHEGSQTILLEKGDQTLTLKKGNRHIVLEDGDASLDIKKGDHKITLHNGQIILDISGGDMVIKTDHHVKIQAKKDISIDASGSMSLSSKGNMSLKSQGALSLEGSRGVQIKSSATVKIQGGAPVSIHGPIIKLN